MPKKSKNSFAHLLGSVLPRSFVVFIHAERLVLHRFGLTLGNKTALRETRTYPLDSGGGLEAALARIGQDFGASSDDSWFVGLPLKYFTTVTFSLPAAAAQNLDQAVHYGLMRHVPFDPAEAYCHYQSQARGDKIEVTATLCLKEQLRPYLEAISAAGMVLSAVFPSLALVAVQNNENAVYLSGGDGETEVLALKAGRIVFQSWDAADAPEAGRRFLTRARAMLDNIPAAPKSPFLLWEPSLPADQAAQLLGLAPDQTRPLEAPPIDPGSIFTTLPYLIDFIPAAVLKQRKRAFWFQAAAAAVLCLSLVALPATRILGKRQLAATLDARITELQSETRALTELRKQNQETVGRLKKIIEYVTSQPAAGEYLKEATEILPDDVWLQSFVFSERQIVLQGVSKGATAAMETLENSPLFKEVHFDSQITRSGDTELFTLVAKVE